jgi:GNAT superfamily N-acetyltransferase
MDRDAVLAADRADRADTIDRLLREATCLVAERDGVVVGFGALDYTFFERGFIPLLFVTEPERRRGIGRALMEALAARCTTPQLFTSTNESNVGMRRLLERLGYEESGIVHNLDPGDPELFFARPATSSGS